MWADQYIVPDRILPPVITCFIEWKVFRKHIVTYLHGLQNGFWI
jgi:hypothetical protein